MIRDVDFQRLKLTGRCVSELETLKWWTRKDVEAKSAMEINSSLLYRLCIDASARVQV